MLCRSNISQWARNHRQLAHPVRPTIWRTIDAMILRLQMRQRIQDQAAYPAPSLEHDLRLELVADGARAHPHRVARKLRLGEYHRPDIPFTERLGRIGDYARIVQFSAIALRAKRRVQPMAPARVGIRSVVHV